MVDYNLGRASGKIEIDYDGTGTSKAIKDLDKAADSSGKLDKQLTKTEKTLHDTDKQMGSSSKATQGYTARLKEAREASANVDRFEKAYQRTLLDSKASLADIQKAHDKVTEAKKQHAKATNALDDAHKALASNLSVSQRALQSLSGTFESASKGVEKFGSAAKTAGGHVGNFVKELATFEAAVGKIGGLTLGVTSLGGLAGIGGGAATLGIVEMAGAVQQLSGALGLLPAAASGVGFSMVTLKVAFHGVGDAIKSMMDEDPKKFLQDIQNMGPVAARAMLQIAGFRDQFELAGAAVQDSFFAKIAADIAPLIQTWLPAVTSGMSQVAGIFGDFGHQFAGILQQPQTMAAFTAFIDNMSKGLQSLQPALRPVADIFQTLTVVGSSFFQQIGGAITHIAEVFDTRISKAAASGALQQWIETGINAFGHLANIVEQFGSTFMNVMSIADKFGGGGLLGFLDNLTNAMAQWTESADGQKSLTSFFSLLRQATDAFLPVLKPLTEGLMTIVSSFTQLGIATAPVFVDFFKTFADVMKQLGPQIAASAPAIDTFLQSLAAAMIRLSQTIGPELPHIFQVLADAFVALLPQLPPLVQIFTQLIEQVGPQLPKLFGAVTDDIVALIPLMPQIIGLTRDFVSALTLMVGLGEHISEGLKSAVDGISAAGKAIGEFVVSIPQRLGELGKGIENFFSDLPHKAEEWGKKLVEGLIHGMLDSAGLSGLDGAANSIVDQIARWFQKSPAEVGPFSGSGYTLLRGQKMVTDMAAGMVSARGAVAAAGRATAAAAAGGLASGGGGGAPAAGGAGSVGNALQPDNIANADQTPLDAYLNHQFPENRGLKGLAKDFGAILSVAQNGFNLIYQHVFQPMMQLAQAVPGANQQTWRKMSPQQQAAELQRKAGQQSAGWAPVLGGPTGVVPGTHTAVGASGVGALSPGATTQDKQLAIIAKGKSLGLSDQEIQGILGIAQEESGFSNTGFLGFGPEAKAQGINIDSDPQAALDLFFKNYMAGGLGSGGPTKSQVVGPGGQILDQQGFINFLWHRMQGAADPAYGSKLSAAIAAQTQLYPGLLSKLGTPTWASALGAPATPADVGPYGSRTLPPRIGGAAGIPLSQLLPSTGGIGENPASRALQVPNAPNVEAGIRAIGGLPTLYPTSGAGAYQVPAWVQQLASAFGLTASTYASGGSLHQMGYAFDFNDPTAPNGPSAAKEAFAQFISSHLAQQTLQLIYRGQQDYGIASGQNVGASGYYAGDLPGHTDHVHWATDVPVLFNGQVPPGSMLAPGAVAPGATTPLSGGDIPLANGQTVNQLLATGNSVNQQQLQAYLQGNPALADQINAAKTPGATDQQVLGALNGISSTITQLQQQDATGNAGTIQALQATQQQIAGQGGFTQGQSGLQSALSIGGAIGSGAANAITGAFQVVSSGLDAAAGTQDIADRLVYGVRGTQDVGKVIDDFQKYITFAADIASEVGNVLTSIGSIISVIGSAAAAGTSSGFGGDPGQAVAAVGQGFQFAGMIASVISGVLQGINTAIDYVQQVNQIIGGYVGRFLSNLTAGPFGGTPLMGNVRMLLNTNTGQLVTYSEDNPLNKNTLQGSSFLNALYGFGTQNPNPQVNTQWNLYAGPGEPVGQVLNHAAFMVESGATTGANGPQNF